MAPQQKMADVVATEKISERLRAGMKLAKAPPGEEVVITGLSGMFPESENVYHFQENLFNKVDLVNDDTRRWKMNNPDIPQRTGKILTLNKFDAGFFGVHYKQAQVMDPACRILLEKAFEVILDAGFNPQELKGSRTGVFIGTSISETDRVSIYDHFEVNGFGLTGCNRALVANWISYVLGTVGPSIMFDTGCSSSLYAVEHAYKAIREGKCDRAIVAGANLCLHPLVSLQFAKLGVLNREGKCKCFDRDANGYARAEATCVIFLQKKKEARRIYATILHAKTNCDGYKEEGITFPASHIQKRLLEEFYQELCLEPSNVDFVEAHGTGTEVGDPEELVALEQVFCKGRTTPLLIGSVKSNMGHSEAASGTCSITKAIIAMETGFIPPNINYENPKSDILKSGKAKVVTEKQPWNGQLIGINSFGFGGANAHVLLQWNTKEKLNGSSPQDSLPRLVTISGRTEEAVKNIFKDLENRPIDTEYVRLYHDIHKMEIPGHVYRGYTLLSQGQKRKLNSVQYYPGTKRPVWFIFTGIGLHWNGMGKTLMQIPAFVEIIEKFHEALAPFGIDVTSVITSENPEIFDNILNVFIETVALQIGMTNILKTVGITPDGLIGHSLGELGCAFADGYLTVEQAAMTAYYYGCAILEYNHTKDSTAAKDLGTERMQQSFPPEIKETYNNGIPSHTVSTAINSVTKSNASLKENNVFSEKINPANTTSHSKHIASVGPILLKYLKKVIPGMKSQSKIWISSSTTENELSTVTSKITSAESYANNLLNSDFFKEACQHIPNDAITIEISPHGMFDAILKHSLHKSVNNVVLMQQNKGLEFLLCSLGKLFELGLQPHMANLYPAVEYPVSRGTPMISPIIRWNHSEDWFIISYKAEDKLKHGERTVPISLAEEEVEFFSGHVIDGRNLFPATGYLVLVWETLARMLADVYTEVSVEFENVLFHRATTMPKEGNVEFMVIIQKTSGKFEVVESDAAVVSGTIKATENPVLLTENIEAPEIATEEDLIFLSSKDVYKELRLRGYSYSGLFRSLVSVHPNGEYGKIRWNNNWVAFMDNMLQIQILTQDTRSLFVPTVIEKLIISTDRHMNEVKKVTEDEKDLPIYVYKDLGIIRSGGIEVHGLNARAIARRKPLGEPVVEKHVFLANEEPEYPALELADVVRACMHITLDNQLGIKVKTVELVDNEHEAHKQILSPTIASVLGDLPLIQADITVLSNSEHPAVKELNPSSYSIEDRNLVNESNSLLVMASNILYRAEVLETAVKILNEGACILAREKKDTEVTQLDEFGLAVAFQKTLENEKLVLLKKVTSAKRYAVMHITDKNYDWLPEAQNLLVNCANSEMNVIFVAQGEPINGILGLFNCIRKESGGKYARCFFIMDKSAPKFDPDLEFYKQQLNKDLAVNVFKDGKWGSYRHLPLASSSVVSAPHAFATVKTRGDLSTFQWLKGGIDLNSPRLTSRQELVHIYYSTINFKDVMLSTGKIFAELHQANRLTEDAYIGLEFSGRNARGERVMGMATSGALGNVVIANSSFVWKVPDQWSLEEAATVTVVYCTAYFAFLIGKLKKGDTVLIHAGSGGVGQAAINICLHLGCTVFTTVGTQEKRDFIKKKYPQLTDRHIGNSRDTSFEKLIMAETGGRGVDIVLNSLAEEKLQASLRCLAPGGRFLEIGKYDSINNNPLGLEAFLKERSFHGIMLDTLLETENECQKILYDVMEEGIKSGAVQPLNRTVFASNELEKAFRFIAAAKHMGKMLIKIRDEEHEKLCVPQHQMIQAIPRYFCHSDYCYVILGGLGGFGLELADWLVLRGARKLVLSSRTGLRTGYQSYRIKIWRSYGANVHISTADITTEAGIEMLLKQASAIGQVDAIFNLAVVLRDALFENQTEKDFAASAGPKADATRHLDKLSRIYCPKLRHFVIFSSVSCGRGNLGQTNYGMNNSVMERICEARVQEGLPGLAIQWGAVGDVGLVADMQEDNTEIVIGGTIPQKISSCLEELDKFLNQSLPVVASMVVAEKRALGSGADTAVGCVSNILGISDLKTVNIHASLAELGMDSMMAVEIKQSLEREFDIYLTPKEIRSLTFSRIIELSSGNEEDKSKSGVTAEADSNAPEGMQLIIRVVGDEKTSLLDIVHLPSLTGVGSGVDIVHEAGPVLFMIPGVEGMASSFESLAANLKYQTICLQMGYKNNTQDVQDLAARLLPKVQSRLGHGESFSLLGYSFGGLVAMELVHMLEEQGRKGQLFLIDSSPEFLQSLTKQDLEFIDMEELQIKLQCHVLKLVNPKMATPENFEKIVNELSHIKGWKERTEQFLKMGLLPEHVSTEHHEAVGNAMYMRIISVLKYKWQHRNPIKSPAILLRPKLSVTQVTEDYGLSQYFEQKVNVHLVDGNHYTILEKLETAKIINNAAPDVAKTGVFEDAVMAEHKREMQSSAFAKSKQ